MLFCAHIAKPQIFQREKIKNRRLSLTWRIILDKLFLNLQ